MAGRIALYSIFLISFFALTVVFVLVNYVPDENMPAQAITPSSMTTDSWGIFDPETGALLSGKNEEVKKPIASITKLFTATAVMESEEQHEPFTILSSDVNTEGMSGKLEFGQRVTPYELLFPLLIESSNDAGEAIRRKLGSTFERSISGISETLELDDTHIADGSGLSAESVSTVSDLSKFYSYMRRTHPHVLDITQLNIYIDTHSGYLNNNPARALPNFTGGKNGYTTLAQKTFIGTFRLEDRESEIGIVLLGSTNIMKDIQALLSYGKAFTSRF